MEELIKYILSLGIYGFIAISISFIFFFLWIKVLLPLISPYISEKSTKELEFKYLKLERILPLAADLNDCLSKYTMLFNTYCQSYILGKSSECYSLENERVIIDSKMIELNSKISLFLPQKYRSFLYFLRKIVSCSFLNPKLIYFKLHENKGSFSITQILSESSRIMNNYLGCYIEVTQDYLKIKQKKNIDVILKKYNINDNFMPDLNNKLKKNNLLIFNLLGILR